MKKTLNYTLLTFYKFIDISNPIPLVEEHKQFCEDIGLKGRIYIGEEGISATVTGNAGQIKAYRLYLDSIPEFRNIPDIDEKANKVEGHKFSKMIVRYRKEIVALGAVYKSDDIQNSRVKMSIDEFKEVMDRDDDSYVIIDMRNDYEYELGHFKKAIPAGTFKFSELESLLSDYKKQYSDKKVIMYCTGGIRCEKAAVMLDRSGLEGVYQLDGGVVKYTNAFDDGNWLGNLYTFDGRVSTKVNSNDKRTVISQCHYTGAPADDFFNCRYSACNKQIIALPEEYKSHFGFCSRECYHGASESLLVRNNFSIDEYNYKQLRGQIKSNPDLRNTISQKIREHLAKNVPADYKQQI